MRHYHRLGLVSEPRRQSNGYRVYGVEDLVRLIRVRWLADNGVPLGSVAAILDRDTVMQPNTARDVDGATDVVTDLTELLNGLRAEQESLARRCDRLARMLDAAKAGRRISALPTAVVDAFASAEEAADVDDSVVEAIRRDRDALEALAISGAVPDDMLLSLSDAAGDSAHRHNYVVALIDWSSLRDRDPGHDEVRAQIGTVAADLAKAIAPVLDITAEFVGQPLDEGAISSAVPDPAQRAAIVMAVELLLNRKSAAS